MWSRVIEFSCQIRAVQACNMIYICISSYRINLSVSCMYIPVHKYVTSFSKASSRKLLFAMKRLINYIE